MNVQMQIPVDILLMMIFIAGMITGFIFHKRIGSLLAVFYEPINPKKIVAKKAPPKPEYNPNK